MTDIPAGMVAWSGGDRAPEDWDEWHTVMFRDGTVRLLLKRELAAAWQRSAKPAWYDILAYTPRQPTPTAAWAEGAPIDAGPNTHDAALGLVAGASVRDIILRIIVAAWDRHSGGETVKPAPWLAEAARDVADHIAGAGKKVGTDVEGRARCIDVKGIKL